VAPTCTNWPLSRCKDCCTLTKLRNAHAPKTVAFTRWRNRVFDLWRGHQFNLSPCGGDSSHSMAKETSRKTRTSFDLSFNTKFSPQNMFSKVISPWRQCLHLRTSKSERPPLRTPRSNAHRSRCVAKRSNPLPEWSRSSHRNTSAISRQFATLPRIVPKTALLRRPQNLHCDVIVREPGKKTSPESARTSLRPKVKRRFGKVLRYSPRLALPRSALNRG